MKPHAKPLAPLALLLLAALSPACLPKDTRPPPSSVLFTASPSDALASQSTQTATEDGWQISFRRALITLGRASLDGDGCNAYSEARYSRVLSLIGAPAEEKISESFALGHCDFGFSVINAESDSLLGSGATADDVSFLRTLGNDKYAGSSGISFYVEGEATRGDQHETFAWKFRGRMRSSECAQTLDGVPVRGLDLAQDGATSVDVRVAPELLFSDNLDAGKAKLRFDAIAAADTLTGDNDGEVTLDELGQVPFADVTSADSYAPGEPGGLTFTTLEDFVYLGVAPTVVRYRGSGKCQQQLRPGRGGG